MFLSDLTHHSWEPNLVEKTKLQASPCLTGSQSGVFLKSVWNVLFSFSVLLHSKRRFTGCGSEKPNHRGKGAESR